MQDRNDGATLVPPAGWLSDADEGLASRRGAGFLFLAGATALAALLRLYGLMNQSLWVDELLTWQTIGTRLNGRFLEQMIDCIQGPLYMAVAWPLVRWQDPALMMRLPSALAGIAAVPLFGVLVGRWWGRRAARLGVLLFALNPFLVRYSQEGRGYSFLILFLVLQGLVFWSMAQRGPRPGTALFFALTSAGAILSNLSGVFLWTALGVSVLVFFRPRSGRAWGLWALAFGLGFVLVLPWLLKASGIWAVDRLVPGAGTGAVLRGESTFSWLAVPYSFFNYFYGVSLGPSLSELHRPDRLAIVRHALPLLVFSALPVAAGLLTGTFRLPRRQRYLLALVVVPLALLVFLAVRNFKPWNPRYVLVCLPWILAITGLGLASLPRRWGLGATILLVGLTLWSLGNYYWNGRYAKADVRGAVAFVQENNAAGDPVLVPSLTPVYHFYHDGPAEVLGAFEWEPLTDPGSAGRFCSERLAGVDACWVVLGRDWYFDPAGVLLPALARSGKLTRERDFDGIRIYHWQRGETGRVDES